MAFCAAPLIAQGGGSIEGQIITIDNLPVPPDVTVRLEAAEGSYLNQAFVGSDGKFSFENVAQGMYQLVVTARGYKTATQTVDMGWLASRNARIYLVPEVRKTFSSSDASTVTATDLSAPKTARKEFEKGLHDLENGNLGGARKHLERAVAEHPCYARAHTILGMALSMNGQFEASEAAFNRSIECDEGFVEAYIQSAIVLNVQNKYQACVGAVQKGLRRFPSEWHLEYQLGIAMDGSGDYASAEEALLKAQSMHPEVPPEFHLRIADVYLNWKKYDKAYAEMANYLRADPRGTFVKPTQMIMRQLEASGMVSSVQDRKDSLKNQER
jgi:Flp pilus assembly protein TadD